MTDQHGAERVRSVVEQPLSEAGFEVVDVERKGPVLQVTVDLLVGSDRHRDRAGGIDLEAVTEASRLVNTLLDSNDLLGAQTTLEVSSPGIERPLRTPEHFRRFVGTEVTVKLRPGTEGERRLNGALEAADDEGVVVGGRRLAYADIDKARTVFVWPAPGQKTPGRAAGQETPGRAAGQETPGRAAGQETSPKKQPPGRAAGRPTKKKIGRAS